MQLRALAGLFSVLRYPARSPAPTWACDGAFYAITGTSDELSVVCESRLVQGVPQKEEKNWRAFRVVGSLDFALTGVLAAIATPLAQDQVSLFAISTFDTDYVLVKADDFDRATDALSRAGMVFVE